MKCSIVLPYYRAPNMLRKQLENWDGYSGTAREHFSLIVVDDGSPESALDVVGDRDDLQLYRILVDKPWNREGARNLAAHVCETEWLINLDIDHVLPPASADALLGVKVNPSRWYRFPRFRVGKADETRRKDAIPDDQEFGQIKPHIDSYLCTRELYWRVGGYDEDYVGHLGGGSPFLEQMDRAARVEVLPESVPLHVYTRHMVSDASISTLSRDTTYYKALRKKKAGERPKNPMRFEWQRLL